MWNEGLPLVGFLLGLSSLGLSEYRSTSSSSSAQGIPWLIFQPHSTGHPRQSGPCSSVAVKHFGFAVSNFSLFLQQPHPEELPCEGEVNSENLLRQAMRNSGIVIERVALEEVQKPDEPVAAAPEELENKGMEVEEEPCVEQCIKLEGAESVCLYSINTLIFFNFPCLYLVVGSTVVLMYVCLCLWLCVRF